MKRKVPKAHRYKVTYMTTDIVKTVTVCSETRDDNDSIIEWFKEDYSYVTSVTPEVLKCEYIGFGRVA